MKPIDPRKYYIEKRLEKIKNIWVISSGKGGVGKSTISSLISLILSHNGYKVGFLDLDFYGPSCHVILGAENLKPNENFGLEPVNIKGIKFMSIIYFTNNNPLVMRGYEFTNTLLEIFTITNWNSLDYLLIDMPPGMGEALLDIIKFLKRLNFLLVTNSSKISMETVEKLIKYLKTQECSILGLLENMKLSISDFILKKCKELEIKYLGNLPFSPEIEDCYGDIYKIQNLRIYKDLEGILYDNEILKERG